MSQIERLVSSNDAFDKFSASSTVKYSVGLKDDTNDTYVISHGSDLDTDVVMSILDNTSVDFTTDAFTIQSASSSATNASTNVLKLKHTTSGNPAAGIGAGISFTVETSNNNDETGMELTAVTSTVTSTEEDFDFVVNLMEGGLAAAQRFKVDHTGKLIVGKSGSNSTIESNGDVDLILQTGNSSTGTITITDGAGGDITLAPNGSGKVVVSTDLTVTGSDILLGNGANGTINPEATAHNAVGKDLTISGGSTTSGTSNDVAGGDLRFMGGQGKGSGAGGDIVFYVANAGSSGNVLNAHSTALTISDDKKATFEGDLSLKHDAAVLGFGDGEDVTLTHVHDTGILLNSNMQIQFGDSGTNIRQSSDGVLSATSDGSIDLNVGNAGVVIKGTTPKLTIGDAGAEDTFLVFDGNAQDYRIGLDDGTDKLEFGVGAAHGTTIAMTIDSAQKVSIIDDLDVGGDILLGNGTDGTILTEATAAGTAGKSLTIGSGSTTAGTADTAGGALTIKSGAGTGTGSGGDIIFQVANAASSSATTLNSHATALTISDDKSATFAGAVVVTGDFTVNGTTTTINTTNKTITDSLIELSSGTTGTPAKDAGFIIERGDSTNAFMGWDESTDRFIVATTTAIGSSTGNLALVVADFQCANIYATNLSSSTSDFSQVIIKNSEDAVMQHTNDASGGEAFTIKSSVYLDNETTANGTNGTHVSVANIQQSQIKLENDNVTLTNASTLFIENAPSVANGSGSNTAITNAFSLYVAAGNSRFADVQATGDLTLGHDGVIINYGTNSEVNLTHVHDTGLQLNALSAATNASKNLLELVHTTSGSPAAGIGAGISFTVETSDDNNETGMELTAVTSTVTSTEEDFDFVVNLMEGGLAAAQRFKVDHTGKLIVGKSGSNSTIESNGDVDLILQTGNSTTGTITITDGADGDITLAPNGTGKVVVSTDLTVTGSDILLGNGSNGTISTEATAHGTAGKSLTISSGSTTAGSNDTAGGALTIKSGAGTGTGAGGDIIFQVANAATSQANTLNSHTTALTISDDKKATFEGDLQVNGDTTTFTSANSTDPLVIIKNTTDDANGARLKLEKDRNGAVGQNNDVNGIIEFYGGDAAEHQTQFAEIKSQVKVATNNEEGGKFTISVAEHNGNPTAGLVIEDGDADGELDVTIGAGTASLTTIAGDLTVTGSDILLGNGTDGTILTEATAAGTAGKSLTIGSGSTTAGTADTAGGALTIKSGAGTGTGSGGDIVFQVANAASSSATTLNSHATALTVSDDKKATFEGDLQVNGESITFVNSSASKPKFTLESSDGGAFSSILNFYKNSGSPADSDIVGDITFTGKDSAGNVTTFGEIFSSALDVTNGSERGSVTIKVAENNGDSTNGLVVKGSTTADTVDVDIGAGTSSTTAVAGSLTVAQNLTVTGNFTANGTTTLINTTNTDVSDNLIVLNKGNEFENDGANTFDSGILIERNGSSQPNAFMGWDESEDRFKVATTTATGSETGNLALVVADFQCANIYATNLSSSNGDFSQVIIKNVEGEIEHTSDASGGEAFTIKSSIYVDSENSGNDGNAVTNSTHVAIAKIMQSKIKLHHQNVTLTNASTLFIENAPAEFSMGSGSNISNTFALYVAAGLSRFANVQATAVTTTSDVSLKENVVQIDNALEKVNNMRGVYFDWKDKENNDNERQLGFIAQEVETVVPELVKESQGIKSVNYSQTVSLLLEAIKEQSVQIKQLQDEVADLKSKVN